MSGLNNNEKSRDTFAAVVVDTDRGEMGTSKGNGGTAGKTPEFLKYLSLVLLTVQNAALILVMRYVRTRPGDMFFATSAVVCSEALKLITSLAIILYEIKNVGHFLQHLYENIMLQPLDCLKVSVPSFIYVIQNNLLYIAVSNLEAATFQLPKIWLEFLLFVHLDFHLNNLKSRFLQTELHEKYESLITLSI